MKSVIHQTARCVALAASLAAITACGDGGSGTVASVTAIMSATYTIGGTVTGLTGSGLVLQSFGVNLSVGKSGPFTFDRQLASGTNYAITVQTQPTKPPQFCAIANDTGTIDAANVTNVSVTCEAGYTVGGTVSGLVGSGLVLQIENTELPNDPSDPDYVGSPLPVNANGAFTLDSIYPAMSSYGDMVRITQQPSSPAQHCLVKNARISIQSANDTSVTVACSEFSYVTNAADNTLSVDQVDATTGALLAVGPPTATGKSPGAVIGTDDRQFVYVGNEGSNDVSVFAVQVETGALTEISGSPFAVGTSPRALTLNFNALYVANGGSNTISAFTRDATTGALTPLSPATYSTGQGPSSLIVDATGQFLYVANNGSNDISAFVIDPATNGLTPLIGSPFAVGASPLSLAFGASGKFLYTANPGGSSASISGFAVDASSGALTALRGSPFSAPVNHAIAADRPGTYLYATAGSGVLGYSIDAMTGLLTSLPGFPVASGADSFSATLDSTDQFLYVANNGSANISGFRFDASTGALTPIAGSPFAAGDSPSSVATQ
jgi:6-phosphogluconolactonase